VQDGYARTGSARDELRQTTCGCLSSNKEEEEEEEESCFQAAFFPSSLAHRNVGVVSKILKPEVPNVPPPHVGASKEEEGVDVVRK
jgi:hypothetical protein